MDEGWISNEFKYTTPKSRHPMHLSRATPSNSDTISAEGNFIYPQSLSCSNLDKSLSDDHDQLSPESFTAIDAMGITPNNLSKSPILKNSTSRKRSRLHLGLSSRRKIDSSQNQDNEMFCDFSPSLVRQRSVAEADDSAENTNFPTMNPKHRFLFEDNANVNDEEDMFADSSSDIVESSYKESELQDISKQKIPFISFIEISSSPEDSIFSKSCLSPVAACNALGVNDCSSVCEKNIAPIFPPSIFSELHTPSLKTNTKEIFDSSEVCCEQKSSPVKPTIEQASTERSIALKTFDGRTTSKTPDLVNLKSKQKSNKNNERVEGKQKSNKKETEKVEVIPEPPKGLQYWVGGIQVDFPVKPYGVQFAVMEKTIRCCKNAEFTILESPTGTGKTLGLLCSALAWQRKIKELGTDLQPELRRDYSSTGGGQPSLDRINAVTRNGADIGYPVMNSTRNINGVSESGPLFTLQLHEGDSLMMDISGDDIDMPFQQPARRRIPRIFYGTRTHKQIQQVVKELRKTLYKDVRMTVLSSREHTCIHKGFNSKKYRNKTEMCKKFMENQRERKNHNKISEELDEPVGCRFLRDIKEKASFQYLSEKKCPSPMDIEDLVKFGQKNSMCPYFTARGLVPSAELIICPYNYLLDPMIRKAMDISLNGDIVILDEAHNIEDITREAASLSVVMFDIMRAIHESENCARKEAESLDSANITETSSYLSLSSFFTDLLKWMKEQNKLLKTDETSDKPYHILSGIQAAASLSTYQIHYDRYNLLKKSVEKILSNLKEDPEIDHDFDDSSHGVTKMPISSNTLVLSESLVQILGYIYNNRMANLNHYNVVFLRDQMKKEPQLNKIEGLQKCLEDFSWTYSANFWCHNSSIIFNEMCSNLRGLVLSSGTMSPMDSFESELGIKFSNRLEGNHVVDTSQVFITSITQAPNFHSTDSRYKNSTSFKYQEGLGLLVLEVCHVVPFGVLCFFPSYNLMEKLIRRWRDTGLWDQLEESKVVLQEPRTADSLTSVMRVFYSSIEQFEQKEKTFVSHTGALLFAVMRGKISEGFDFADNAARAVITVGIPYPGINDLQIKLKKAYNDTFCKTRGLLTGRQWYDTQAFRPLNQALGRCIRHRNDWGAIILADARFASEDSCVKKLSKWIQRHLVHHTHCRTMIDKLQMFVQKRLTMETKPMCLD